jgi:hypothetical protein
VKIIASLCLVVAFTMCSSCGSEFEYGGQVIVSPDGRLAGYLTAKESYVPWPPGSIRTRQEVSLAWSPTAKVTNARSVEIEKWGISRHGESLFGQTHFAISPDSSRIAAVYPGGLLFVHTSTGVCRRYTVERGERIVSLAWLDDDTVGYSSYRELPGDEPTRIERTIWRQRFDQGMAERSVIHRDEDFPRRLTYSMDWSTEFWSPDGRYVLLEVTRREEAYLLDVARKALRKLPGEGSVKEATWGRDSRKVLWHGFVNHVRTAYLHDLVTGKTVDLSDNWRQLFCGREPGLEPLWTPDNRFIAGCNRELGGYLLSPDPWEARLIGKSLMQPDDAVPPYLRAQPAPGLLVSFPHGEAVYDYHGRLVRQLGRGGAFGWTVLPGGKTAVSVENEKRTITKWIAN